MKTNKKYKFAVIATDVAIFTINNGSLNVLLIKMKKHPYEEHWALPGGLIKGDESVDNAAKRILSEKTSISDVYLEQLYTFGDVKRDPFGRVVSVAYFALVPGEKLDLKTSREYAGIKWFPLAKLPKLAYDHKEIVERALKRLRAKLGYSNIVCNLLGEEFSLSEMQDIYETILGKKLDKRNFRKKMLSLGLLKKTGKERRGEPNRPAELYSFKNKHPKIIEVL